MTVEHSIHNVAVLHIKGALRAPTSGELRKQVRKLLACGERRILIDLSDTDDIDAAGLGELVRVHNLALAGAGVLRITGAGSRIRTLLARVGLLEILEAGGDPTARGDASSRRIDGAHAQPPALR
jgi:anti-anti-sigma factor